MLSEHESMEISIGLLLVSAIQSIAIYTTEFM